MTIRVNILNTAAKLTSGERDKTYGDPRINLSHTQQLYNVLSASPKFHLLPSASQAALFLVCAKLSRIACGSHLLDNYIDGAAYLAIAGESAQEQEDRLSATASSFPDNAHRRGRR